MVGEASKIVVFSGLGFIGITILLNIQHVQKHFSKWPEKKQPTIALQSFFILLVFLVPWLVPFA